MVHEIKGDTVAPGREGLLNLNPDDFVFYVGGYPSNFTVGLAQSRGRGSSSGFKFILLQSEQDWHLGGRRVP